MSHSTAGDHSPNNSSTGGFRLDYSQHSGSHSHQQHALNISNGDSHTTNGMPLHADKYNAHNNHSNGNGHNPSPPSDLPITMNDRSPLLGSLSHSTSSSTLSKSLADTHSTVAVAPYDAKWYKKLASYSGMGLMVAVGYIDPGNWATDLAGGSTFGYNLLFVILLSNGCAILLQHLALKLGVATGRDLAQSCRDHFSRPVSLFLWFLCEIAIGACDLAEVIGSAIALNLLFNLPLPLGCMITAADVLLILLLEQSHIRYLELAVAALMLVIAICFSIVIGLSHPDPSAVASGFVPHTSLVTDGKQLMIGLSILGATVMPHNLYLHSHLILTRAFPRTNEGKTDAIKWATYDSTLSLGFAFIINCMILILAGAVFYGTANSGVADLNDAYRLLTPALGPLASTVFALALLASGQNSTITGTLAGQLVFEGFLDIQVAPWLRRLITRGLAIVPATIVASVLGAEAVNQMLIISQLVLSLQLGFAVIPLLMFTSNPQIMGQHVNSKPVILMGMIIAGGIVALNIYLVIQTLSGNGV